VFNLVLLAGQQTDEIWALVNSSALSSIGEQWIAKYFVLFSVEVLKLELGDTLNLKQRDLPCKVDRFGETEQF
jgi:hypothetical protein